MNVLHLSADFPNHRIYVELVAHLAAAGARQTVYSAVRRAEEASWRAPELAAIPVHLRHILRKYHRLLFRTKVRLIERDLLETVDVRSMDVVHAHFLYSDGAVALRLYRRLGIPFVTAVRNADVNAFMRLRPDLQWIRNDVLRAARGVYFLSPAYRDQVLGAMPRGLRPAIEAKSAVVPNGIGPAWLIPPPPRAPRTGGPLRLLYIGDFTANKNLPNVFRAGRLIARERAVQLTLVGGGGDGEAAVRRLIDSGEYPFVSFVGRVTDAAAVRELYRAHDILVMPSFAETFGVVYVEALSQGVPIVHSRGQGVDGYFSPGTVSERVDPDDPADIARKVQQLADRLPGIRGDCVSQAQQFAWPGIAATYVTAYRSVLQQSSRR